MVEPKTYGARWYWNGMRLDQGEEGACVGFGHTQGYNSSPKTHKLGNDYAQQVYREATLIDEWPNEDWTNSSGTSVRAGAKIIKARGLIEGYAFTYSVHEIAMWLLNKGPVVIGVDWWTGMDNPNEANNYYITPTGYQRGGHCTLLDGIRWWGQSDDYIRGLNSWGPEYGYNGRFRIRIPEFTELMSAQYATGCTWVEKV